jgi:hypothetical protein
LRAYTGTPSIERVFNDAYALGVAAGIARIESPIPEKKAVIDALRADVRRSVYEGGDAKGQPSGRYFVDYGGSAGLPGFTIEAVSELVEEGYLVATGCAGLYSRGPRLKLNDSKGKR